MEIFTATVPEEQIVLAKMSHHKIEHGARLFYFVYSGEKAKKIFYIQTLLSKIQEPFNTYCDKSKIFNSRPAT